MTDHDLDQRPTLPEASPTDSSAPPDADIRARLAAHPWPVFGAALTERLRADAAARAASESAAASPTSPSGSRHHRRATPTAWSRREVWGTAALALLLVALVGLAWQAGSMRNAQPGPAPFAPAATPESDGIGQLPEGAAVAWFDDDGLWYLERGGPARPLAPGGYLAPRISPDRQWVAFQDLGGTIYLVSTAGGEPRILLDSSRLPVTGATVVENGESASGSPKVPLRRPMRLTWTPDSRSLVFSSIVMPQVDPHGNEVDDLWAVDLADSEPRRLLPPGRAAYFAISPDGRHVAASGSNDGPNTNGPTLELVDLNNGTGHTLLKLAPILGNGPTSTVQPVMPHWMPDGQALLIALPKVDAEGARHAFGSEVELVRLPLDGAPATLGEVVVSGGALNGVRWSPDGMQTAYVVPADVWTSATLGNGSASAVPGYPPPSHPDPDMLVVGAQDGSRGQVVTTGQNMVVDEWSPGGKLLRVRDRSLTRPGWRIVRLIDQQVENLNAVASLPVVRFVGPRDLLYIWAAPNARINVHRFGVGGSEQAQTKSGTMVEFDIVAAGEVPDEVPPATAVPVVGMQDMNLHATPFPTRTIPGQPTIVPLATARTPEHQPTITLVPTISPENEIESFSFVPGTADVAFTVAGNYPANPRALFVRYMDPTSPQSVTRADSLAAVPSGFSYVASVRAGAVGGPLFVQADRGDFDYDLLPVDRAGKYGSPIAGGRYNPIDFAVSRAGDRLAILTEDGRLLVREVASGLERQVGDDYVGAYGGAAADFGFSSDGRFLAVISEVLASQDSPGGYQLDLIDAESGGRDILVRVTSAESSASLTGHAFAKDGKSIYYLARTSAADDDLMVVGAQPGAKPRRIGRVADLTGNTEPATRLDVLPDGQSILVLQDLAAIYRVDPVAGTSVRLTPPDDSITIWDFQVTTAHGRTWLAYRLTRSLGAQSGRVEESSDELLVLPLD